MDITMIGLQNAGKTSLLRVLAVRALLGLPSPAASTDIDSQGGEFTLEYVTRPCPNTSCSDLISFPPSAFA